MLCAHYRNCQQECKADQSSDLEYIAYSDIDVSASWVNDYCAVCDHIYLTEFIVKNSKKSAYCVLLGKEYDWICCLRCSPSHLKTYTGMGFSLL